MQLVESYRVTWNIANNSGTILLQTPDGIEHAHILSPAEGLFILELLRKEDPVYTQNGLLFTGFEPEAEEKSEPKKSRSKK